MTKIKIGIILALVTAVGGLGWLYRAELKRGAQLAQTVVQQRATLGEMEQELSRAEKMRKKAEARAAEHKQRIGEIRKQARGLRDEVRRLEKENQAVADWADNDLPGAVFDLCVHAGQDSRQD